MPIEITPISPNDVDGAIDCIQLAFDSDPYNNWAFDKRPGKFNRVRNHASLKAKCEWGMKHALFYVAKDTDPPDNSDSDSNSNNKPSSDSSRIVGVSMWMPPRHVSTPETWSEWWDGYVLWLKQGLNVLWYGGWGGLNTSRYWIWKREQALAQSEIWTDSEGYYFCNIVVVRPGVQGKGIGRKLFEVVTKGLADKEGRKCYLESSRDVPNIAIYEKMGFRLAKKMVCDDGEAKCDLFCMVREPQRG